MAKTFDINIDCGESFGNWKMGADDALMPLVTTANVACGFHAGDPVILMKTVELARSTGAAVGSHPGLPDLMGFGRRVMAISPDELYAYTVYQTGALKGALEAKGMTLHHVKPHGALYRMLNTDEPLAKAFVQAIIDVCPAPMMYYPAPAERHVVTRVAAAAGIDVVPELYFDLPYDDDGTLVLKRSNEGADLTDTKRRLEHFLKTGEAISMKGKSFKIEARSICLHGDGPNAVDLAKTIGETLMAQGYVLKPLAPAPKLATRAAE
jgi:UPF0271 protein